jgi:hypothetical protein
MCLSVCASVAMMESHIYDGDMWHVSKTIAAVVYKCHNEEALFTMIMNVSTQR